VTTRGTQETLDRFAQRLDDLKLPVVAKELGTRLVQAGFGDAVPIVLDVLDIEADERRNRRVARLRQASKLPLGKTFDTLDQRQLPRGVAHKLEELAQGSFAEQAVNVLAFGLPGVGKTHAACALGHALVERGVTVLFTPTYRLVQELLAAKRNLELPRALRKLDLFDVVILDDIGYVQQSSDEVEVLFTLMAERYERRSMLITSNLVFSQWDRIFKNPMTTAAAIDRLVHHSVILEFDCPSYRTPKAGNATARPLAPARKSKRRPAEKR